MSQFDMIAEPIEPITVAERSSIAEPIPTDEPATFTTAEVLAAMRNRLDQLWALDVEYDYLQKSFVGDDNVVPFGRNRDAFSRDKRYKSQSGQDLVDCPTVFFPRAIWAWNGELQQNFHPCDPSAYIEHEKSGWVDSSPYLNNACIPVGSIEDEIRRSKQSCCNHTFVTALFDSRRNWIVHSHLEVVDDAPCCVLTDGDRHTFWIDLNLGFASRLLEIFTTKHLNRAAFRNYQPIRDGIHAPWHLSVEGYDRSLDNGSRWGDPFSLIEYRVRRFVINSDVDEALFNLSYPIGTVVHDSANMRFYRIGDNNEEIKLGDWN